MTTSEAPPDGDLTERCPTPEHLQDFLHGRLSSADDAAVTRHADQCRDCLGRLERLATASEPARRPAPLRDGSGPDETFLRHVLRMAREEAGPAGAPPLPAVPGYEILGELGRGGVGIVYEARHLGLGRLVALKMLLPESLAGGRALARFRSEAEAAARLQHPNIVQIHDVGSADGRPFLALELLPGGTLAGRLAGAPQGARPAAALVETLARAVHFAHERGVVHRDLKPANILLAGDGTPKVADFGLAKCLDRDTVRTRTGDILGTPSYMAPEQARGDSGNVGPAADVYALGAVLYECLTGRPPFREATLLETARRVIDDDPVPPGRLRAMPRDLETVCLKCLRKAPADRYSSAGALADDLRHFLAGEPIQARPISPWERGIKWAKRHPAAAALTAVSSLGSVLLVAGLVVGILSIANALAREKEAKDKLDDAYESERLNAYFNGIALAQREWEANKVVRAEQVLDDCRPGLRHWEWHYLKRLCHADLLTIRGASSFTSAAFDPAGRRLAAAEADQTVKVWDAATGKELLALPRHKGPVTCVVYSPDGRRLAVASGSEVKSWDASSGRELATLSGEDRIAGLAYSRDGKLLAVADDKTVRLWDVSTSQEVRRLGGLRLGHHLQVLGVAFSPDGKRLASAGEDRTVKVWDTTTGEQLVDFRQHTGPVHSVAYSPDGLWLASAGEDRTVMVWDARSGQVSRTLYRHDNAVLGVAFSPDGRRIASASGHPFRSRSRELGEVKLWDAASGREIHAFRGHTDSVLSVAFRPDGKRLASASWDKTVKVWDVTGSQETLDPSQEGDKLSSVVFSPDGKHLASAGEDKTVKTWDVATRQEVLGLRGHTGPVEGLVYSPDGRYVASASRDATVKVWDLQTAQEALTLKGHTSRVNSVTFRPDGQHLATASHDTTVKVWDAATGRELRTLPGGKYPCTGVAYSPDGTRLAAAGGDSTVRVWNPDTGQELLRLSGHGKMVKCVAFSPDGELLATASADQTVVIWNSTTGEKLFTLGGHADVVAGVVFSPDGKRLASGSWDHTVKVWHTKTGRELLTLRGHTDVVTSVAFSSDGNRLASASWDATAKLWDATPLPEPSDARAAPARSR